MKLGLVLSGGGARGIAHVGVLKFLEEKGIHIDAISGTSAGAIAGSFYAAGYSAARIIEILKTIQIFKLMRPSFSASGFFRTEKISAIYEKYLPATFEELSTSLWISATNVEKGRTKFFMSGELVKPLIASCCLPMLFEPVTIDKSLYVDGGMLNNLPVEPLLDKCDRIIGVHVNPTDDEFHSLSMTRITQRCIELSVKSNVDARKNYCSLFIEPEALKKVSMYSLSAIDHTIKVGYEAIAKKWTEFEPSTLSLA